MRSPRGEPTLVFNIPSQSCTFIWSKSVGPSKLMRSPSKTSTRISLA